MNRLLEKNPSQFFCVWSVIGYVSGTGGGIGIWQCIW
jgi:hypothetical protein